MIKPKNAAKAPTPAESVDWTGTRTQRLEYQPDATIFAQGDPAPRDCGTDLRFHPFRPAKRPDSWSCGCASHSPRPAADAPPGKSAA